MMSKRKIRKFFKSLFFTNKVNNRIMHNNLSSFLKELINNNKQDNLAYDGKKTGRYLWDYALVFP